MENAVFECEVPGGQQQNKSWLEEALGNFCKKNSSLKN